MQSALHRGSPQAKSVILQPSWLSVQIWPASITKCFITLAPKARCNLEFQKWNKKSCSSFLVLHFLIGNISHNCLEWTILNINMSEHNYLCVKIIVYPWQRLKGHSVWLFLFFLFTYSKETLIGNDKECCAVTCTNLPNEMNPFHQHVPPPCCITLITHGSLHNWNKHKREGWRERALMRGGCDAGRWRDFSRKLRDQEHSWDTRREHDRKLKRIR